MRTVRPPPFVFVSEAFPRCAPRMPETMARPRPEPPDLRLRDESAR